MTACGRCGKNLLCACEHLDERPDPKLIISRACAELRLAEPDFYSRRRTQEIAAKRQIVIYLLWSITAERHAVIARWINRDCYSTVIHSVYRTMRRMKRETEFARMIARVEAVCRASASRDESKAA